jgi:hypothetical protein
MRKLSGRISKELAGVFAICATATLLLLLGAMLGGAGHGTSLFLNAALAPMQDLELPYSILLWPAIAIVFFLRQFLLGRISLASMLLFHYVGVIWYCLFHAEEWHYVRRVGPLALFWLLPYLAMQILLWLSVRRRKKFGLPVGKRSS